ncbi:hypothetical protein ElyMa_004706100, partial [Elysia marginata]
MMFRQDCPHLRRNHFDYSTCVECCRGDLCNVEGCGSMSIMSSNQLPCLACSDISDPSTCSTTTICQAGQ